MTVYVLSSMRSHSPCDRLHRLQFEFETFALEIYENARSAYGPFKTFDMDTGHVDHYKLNKQNILAIS